MSNISGVVITKNEESNIIRCLSSLSKVADEIIIVDAYSKDKTEELCNQFNNVTFIKREFKDFSDQKNYANNLAKYEYILSLDSDEELSDTLIKDIKEIKKNFAHDAYWFNRRTNYCGKWIKYSGWYPDSKIRLWKKALGSWDGKLHEQLILKTNNIGKIKSDILHYSFPTINSHLSRINFYSDLAAKAMFEKGKKPRITKLIISPIVKFFKKYFFQLGILDGYYGLIIAVFSAYGNFNKYAKHRDYCIKHSKKIPLHERDDY